MSSMSTIYTFLATTKRRLEARFWKAVKVLRAAGLTVHEIEMADGSSKVLGWEIEDGGFLGPALSRLWRCRLGIRELLRRGRASGQQLERLIGHMTFVSLCRRESLSVLGDCYTFIKRNYTHSTNLWKSVRKELWQWDGLAPLIRVNMKLVWGDTIYAVDASDWGLGVVSSAVEPKFSQQLGRFVERWRFKEDGCNNPRPFVQVEGELEGVHRAVPNPALKFKGVPFTAVDRPWQVVGRKRWQREETMPVYEARATQYAVRHILRNQKNFGKKFIVLTDSMTAAVSFDKGRAQSFRLRRVVQQTAALCLGSGTLFRCRWVPSEWNPADGPSRGSFAPLGRFTDFGMIHRQLGITVTWDKPSERKRKAPNLQHGPAKRAKLFDANPVGIGGMNQAKPSHAPLTWDIELSNMPAAEKRKQRAKRRQQKTPEPGMGVLRSSSVGHLTLKRYQEMWRGFVKWSAGQVRQTMTWTQLDRRLSNYLEGLYLEGEDLSRAN